MENRSEKGQGGNMETGRETYCAIIQERDDTGLVQGDNGRKEVKRGQIFGCILKVDLTGFVDAQKVSVREREEARLTLRF